MLVFLVGLFALSGLFAADAKIVATEGGVSSSWSSASWVDSNGNSVQAPINTGDDAILNAMDGAITLTLENDLTITDLFVYGEKGVTIDLNNHTLNVATIFIGSGPGHALITTDEANCLGNLTFTNGSVVSNVMNTTSYGDPAKTPNLTKNVLTIGDGVTSFAVNNCWYVGDYTEAQITNPGNAQLNITRNIDGAPNFVKVLSDQLTTLRIPENVFYWTGANGTDWTKKQNWTGGNGSYPMSTGDVAVFDNTNDITITNIQTDTNATIHLRRSENINNNGTVVFVSNLETTSIFAESGNYRFNAQNFNNINVLSKATVTFCTDWSTVKGKIYNEGSVILEKVITVVGDIVNNGIIDIAATTMRVRKNYSGNGTIKSAGGTFNADVENNDTSTYEPVRIKKLELQDGTNYSIYLQTNGSREIHLLENDTGIGTIQIDNVTLPKGNYEEIKLTNQPQAKLTLSGDIVVNTISGSYTSVYVGENTLKFNEIGKVDIYVTNGSELIFAGENGVADFNSLNFYESSSESTAPVTLNGEKKWELSINNNNFPTEIKQLILSGNIEIKAPWQTPLEIDDLWIKQGAEVSITDNIKLTVDNILTNDGTLLLNTGSLTTTVSNFTNNGKVTQNGTLTINGDFDSGDDSSSTYASVTLAPTSDEVPVTVSGYGQITTLNSGNNLGGKTINFDDNITITGTNSNLKGSGNENKLNIDGTGAITVKNANAISAEYLNFLSSSSPIVKENYIKVNNSSAPNGIFPAGWIDDKTYIWTGAVSDYLPEAGNWKEGRVPPDGDNNVSIIVTKPTESSNPFVMQTSNNKQYMINFIIEENAEAQIPAGAFVEVTGGCTNSGTLTNSGELTFREILSSSGTITNNNLITIENDFVSTGTITNKGKLFIKGNAEISGTYLGTNDSLYIINQDEERKTVTINSPITIGTLFIAGNVDLELNADVTVTKFETNAGDTNFIARVFEVNIGGTGSLSTTSMDFTRASSTDDVIGTYNLNVPVTCSGEIKTHSGSVLNIKSNTQTNTLVHSANNANYQTFINVKSNASLTVNETIDLAANANSGASLSVESGATVKAKSIIDTSTFANGEGQIPLTNYGTIEVSESIDLTTISNSGIITATTAFTATNYLRPTDSTSDVVNIKEGTTLSIENGTISTLNVEKTDDETDFATISSTGTLTISSATYNNADIQTSGTGTIKLANTGDSDTIGNLTIETGELTIEDLNVGNLTNKAKFSSSTVNITGDLTDSGTSFAGTINFVGNGEQTFTPNASTSITYDDINIGDGTSTSTTIFAGKVNAGNISINEKAKLQTNDFIEIDATSFEVNEGAELILKNATVTTSEDSTYRGLSGTGFTISAAESKKITIDQDTVETEGNQNYFASVKLTKETTFKSGGTIIFGNTTTDAFVKNGDVAPKLILQAPTVIYGNSTIDSITTSDSLSFESDNTINNLSVTNAGGKTLTINGSISVGTLSLSGTKTADSEENKYLKIDGNGSGSFNLTTPPAQYVGNYLKFAQPNTPTVSVNGDNNQKAKIRNSKDSADGITSFPSGWEYDNTFTWTGATSNDWNVATNWDQGEVPNETSDVIIPADKKVIISGDFTHSGTITNNGELTFGENAGPGQTVTDVYTFTNNGTITNSGKLKVNGNLTNSSSATIANSGKLEVGLEAGPGGGAVPPCTFANSGTLQNAQNSSNETGVIKIKGTFDNTNGNVTNFGKITLNSDFDLTKGFYTEVGSLSFEGKKDPNTGDVSTIEFTPIADPTLIQIEAKNVQLKIKGKADINKFVNDNAIVEIPTGSNVSIQNYSPFIPTDGPDAGQPREKNDLIIYEGATVDIKNDVTITNLTVQTSTDDSDFAYIITKNLSVTNATYNTADIKTKGNITLPETTETTNEIRNLEIESGNLTIPNLIANKVSNGGKLSASGSVTITTDLSKNTGTVETATLSVGQDISNNAVITTTTTNVGRNLTDNGTSFEGTINFVGTSAQTFTPNTNTIYDDINIGDGTSASITTLTKNLKAGVVTIKNNSTLQTNGSGITNIEITRFDIEDGSHLILNGAMVTTSDATTYRGLSGTEFTISAGTNSITIDQETVQTTAGQVYESPVTLARNTTFEITGDGNALVFEKPITTNGNYLTAKTNEGDITFGSENSEAFFDKATVVLQGPATIYGENEFASITSNDSLTLINNNTVETLSVTNAGGKTLTIDGQITVTTMELSGTNTDNLLQIDGSGKFSFTAEPSGNVGTYLKFINKESPMVVIPDKPNGMNILTDSLDHAGGTTEFPSGWKEIIGENTRTWEGDVSSDWDEPENWEEGSIPNEESKVVIHVVGEGNNYPVTNETDVISVKSLNVDSGATITLNNTLTATDGITNFGTINLPKDYTLSCAITNNGKINAENSVVIPDGVQLTNTKNIDVKGNLSIETGATLENNKNSNNRILVYGDLTIAGSYSGEGTIYFANHTKPHTITNSTDGTAITSLGIVGTQINFVCDSPLTIGTLTKEEGTIYLQSGSLSVGTYSQDSNIPADQNNLKLNEGATISFTNPVAFNSVEIINNESSIAEINATDFTTETLNVYGDFTNANSNAINATTMTVDMNQADADSDVVIGGKFSVGTFNCKEQGGKSLEVNGVINMNEMFISGTKNAETDETNYLTLQGTGSFAYNDENKTQFVGSYLKFTSDTPIVSEGHAEITSSEHNGTAFPTGWILPSETTWTGGLFYGQRWSNEGNWTKGVPTISTKVKIPTLTGLIKNYPSFGDQAGTLIEMLSLEIAEGAKITAANNSSVETFKVYENFTNDGNISNTADGSSPFAIWVGGNLTNNSTGTINTNSAIEVHGALSNSGSISGSNYSISAYGNVSLLGGSITGYSAFYLINTNSRFNNTFNVDSSYTLPSLTIQEGGFYFDITDTLKIENTLKNDGMLNVQKGTLIVPTYEGSGDIYLYKGSNLTITNYAGTGTIYLEEGATLIIKNGATIPNLDIKITSDETDFATISTNGNIIISSATYNSGDIKTVGNFILPSTESTTNEIGNLLIESGKLTIETLHAENITTKENSTLKVENGTITVSENLQNNGSTKAKTLTVKNVENNKDMNVETANVSGDFIDNDSFVVSTINFIGENNQEFLPSKEEIVYFEINVTKTSGTFTATTNPLKVGTLNLESPENNFGEVVANSVILTNAGNTTFAGNVICNHTLTITNATQTTFNESVQIQSLTTTENSGKITFAKGGTNSTATEIHSSGDVTFGTEGEDSTFIFGAEDALENFTHNAGTTFIYGTIKAANITLADSEIKGTITTGKFVAEDCIFNGELNANNVTVKNLNSSTGSVNINLSGDFTNNGGTVKINKLTLLDSSILTGNLTIGEFIATQSLMTNPDDSKTLTITNKLIVDSMKISGQKDEIKITIANSGEIQYSTFGSFNVGQYIKFDGENPKITNGIGLVAKVEYVNALPNGWEEINTEYIWKGNDSDEWETDNNWEFGEAPLEDEEAVVIIPSENITNFPVLSETTKIKYIEIKEGATLSVNNNGSLEITEVYKNLGTLINAGTVQIDFEVNFANSTIQNNGTLNLVGKVDFSQTTYTNDDNNSDKIYITNDEINSAIFTTSENQKAGEIYLKGNITSVELNGNVSFKHLEIENQSTVNTVTISSSNGGNLQAGSLTNKETLICNTNVTIVGKLINDYVIQIPQGISLSANTYSVSSPFATSDRKVILSEGASLTIGNQESATSTIAKIEFVKTPETDFATISTNGNLTISSTVYKINDESVDIKTSGNGTIKLPSTESTTNEIGNLLIESGKLTIETLHAANITNNGTLNATTSVQANNIENAGKITTPTVKANAELSNAENATITATNGSVTVGANLTNDGILNATTSVEATNITNAGEITTPTVKVNADLTNAENATITATNGSITVGTNLTNDGEITSDTVLATGDLSNDGTLNATTSVEATNITNSGSMNVATTNVGGNLIDNGTWSESGIINFVGTNDQSFDSNPATKYAKINVENSGGILTINDVLNVTNLQIYSNVIFEDTATIENLSIDMSSSEDENFVKFAGEKTYTITTLIGAKGNQNCKLKLASTNDKLWNVYFENKPEIESFEYVEVSKSQSVDENGSVKELNYIEAEENLLSDEECTTIGWFNFNSYYWTGNQSTEWAEVKNWARRPDGNGMFAVAPSKNSSTLKVYILQTAVNSLIENDGLITINLLDNPEGKTVELNKGAEIQTIKNAGQIATQESVNVTTFENTGTIFVNAGILTIENYVPTSDKINIKEAATLKITKAEETTISDLTFEKTDSSTEDFASLLGNISVTSATYSEADIQTEGTIKLPSTESTTNEIGNLLIGSGNLTIEILHGANLTNEGTLSTKTVTVTQNITNAGEITSDTVLATGDLTNNGTLNATTSVEANNIVNAGEITTPTVKANGELTNAENATITATNGSITVGTNLTNDGVLSTKTVTVTENITNNGNLNATTSVEANNIVNAGEITTLTLIANGELTNAENATIIATNGSVTVGTNLTNDGTLSTKTVTVTQNITNAGELTSDTVLATGDLTNNGNLNAATSVEANNIVNSGEITSDTVLANNDLENNGTLNATTSVEANNIINTGEITTPTVKANAELSNAENATITATNGSVTVGTNLTNDGTLSTKTIIVTQNITNSGSMNVATTNVGGNLIDNGTWAESGIINFVGTNDQSFDSNPITTYALINVEKSSGILTLANDLNAKDFVLKGGDLFINKTLTTQRDVILLGKKYSIKDSVTNVDLFDYKGEVEFEILDTTLLGTKVQLADDASIFVGKNFYANGIDISGGKIFIQKPINFAPFAQSFNGEILNNKAICSCADCETEPNQTHAKIMAVGCVDKGENSGWDFDDATILKAQTVRDDVIKVFVNQPLAKISDENLSEFKFLIDDELNGSFQGIYSNVDCTQVFEDEIGTFDQTENSYYFFLKATSKWNTDASGSFVGNVLSTASDNLHYNSIPVIDIPRYTQEKGVIVKNKWGKPFANLSSRFFNGSSFVNVSDNCGPVLIEVKTGQEVHNLYDEAIGQSSQPSYDAHNFIEFEYSEPIIFKGNAYSSLDENIFVTSEFGQTDNSGGTLKINGLALFQKGKLITQSKDSTIADNQVNAFYRKDEYSFRFSVAGLTNGTIEYNSNEYKNWIGYIEEAEIPSGTVTLEFDSEGKNPFIQDLQLNHQEEWTSAPKLVVDSSFAGDFGTWDLSSPNFAFHVSEDKKIDWYEFVGNGDGFIKNIEFHLFDNDLENNPSVYDGAVWQTREGWLNQAGVLKIPESYAADIFGGSRPFISDEQNRTAGGIRLSSVYNTFENFEYSYGQIEPKSFVSFDTNVSAALFQSSSHDQTRISNGADGLYFALGITEIGLPLKTTFSVSYKSTDTLVVTDLAGNKLKDAAKISSYDVTPPAFTISVTPHNSDEIYMLFSEQINFADFEVKLSDNSSKTYNLVESISNVFEFGHIVDGHWQTIQDLKVESIKERKVFDAHTEIVLKLNKKLNFEQIQQIYIRVAKGLDNTVDVVTGSHNANVTLIQDDKGNYMMQYMAHPISDFAVDVLNLNYAYNSDIVNPSASENLDTTKEQKSRVVHDWSRTQANFGTLLLNHDITFNGTILAESIADTQMIFSSSPEKESVASFYNEWTKKDSRIWLAEIPGFESLKFDSWSKENNSSVQFVPSEKQDDSITFDILKEQIPDVTSLSFLFALKDANSEYLTVNHYPAYNYSTKMYDLGQKFPLFALRLDNKEDIKSFDLWSLKLDSISLQRGGVTILNNVINPLLGDKAILKLDLAQKARVNILVMTLDGNIVKYLNRGSLDSGEYQFTWDGTNNSSKPVARGMYFIRVFGNGIDETRKVLVVK